jgi:hypothetical protein
VPDAISFRLLLATLVGWLDRRQQDAVAYLIAENRILRGHVRGRIRLTDEERRRLARLGHPHDEPPNLNEYTRTPTLALRVRPFPCDELPMPPKNRVGSRNGGDIPKAATTEPVSVLAQPTAFLVGQAEPAAHVPTEDAVFFDQVGHGVLRPSVEPAGQRREQQAQRHRVGHGASVYITARVLGLRRPSAEQ